MKGKRWKISVQKISCFFPHTREKIYLFFLHEGKLFVGKFVWGKFLEENERWRFFVLVLPSHIIFNVSWKRIFTLIFLSRRNIEIFTASNTDLVWTQSIGFPTYCRVVTAIENVTSKMTVAFVCKRKIAESIFTWFI
jgi:hypothetical protein